MSPRQIKIDPVDDFIWGETHYSELVMIFIDKSRRFDEVVRDLSAMGYDLIARAKDHDKERTNHD